MVRNAADSEYDGMAALAAAATEAATLEARQQEASRAALATLISMPGRQVKATLSAVTTDQLVAVLGDVVPLLTRTSTAQHLKPEQRRAARDLIQRVGSGALLIQRLRGPTGMKLLAEPLSDLRGLFGLLDTALSQHIAGTKSLDERRHASALLARVGGALARLYPADSLPSGSGPSPGRSRP